jgi:hypothetical protein
MFYMANKSALLIQSRDLRLTYYHDPRIHRRIRYGPAEREYLDIYAP